MADWIKGVLTVVEKSWRLGFAALLGGLIILLGREAQLWPTTLVPAEAIGWIAVAMIFGGVLVAVELLQICGTEVKRVLKESSSSLRLWARRLNASRNLHKLDDAELAALIWMLVRSRDNTVANRLAPPWEGLVRKGFMIPADPDPHVHYQRLFVAPRIIKERDGILDNQDLAIFVRGARNSATPPWERRF